MTTTEERALRYIDSDGHILEPPTGCSSSRRRSTGTASGTSTPTATARVVRVQRRAHAGDRARGHRRLLRRRRRPGAQRRALLHARPGHQVGLRRSGWQTWTPTASSSRCCTRPSCSVLQSLKDVEFGRSKRGPTTSGAPRTSRKAQGRLFGAGALPPIHHPDDVQAVVDEIRYVAELPGMVSVFMRPNPAIEWRYFNDPVYDPIWAAAAGHRASRRLPPVPRARPSRRVRWA